MKKYKHTEAEKKKIKSLGLNLSQVTPEAEFRQRVLNFAKLHGIEVEVRTILERYEKLAAAEPDAKTREQIATIGLAELHKYINFSGGLTVNLKPIIPEDKKDDSEMSYNIEIVKGE